MITIICPTCGNETQGFAQGQECDACSIARWISNGLTLD